MALRLAQLCLPWPHLEIEGREDIPIERVDADSRRCGPGSLFVAVKGAAADGHDFVAAAVEAGCAAVAVETGRRSGLPLDVAGARPPAVVTAASTSGLPALLSRELVGRPDEELLLVGVTGTNGKTTVAFLVRRLLADLVGGCGLLGTVRYETGGPAQPAPLTTPDGPVLFELLRQMRDNNLKAAAMEVSSHALDQQRVAGLALDVAVLTNLGRDHLDYHRDREAYREAKLRILDLVGPAAGREKAAGMVAVNVADPVFAAVDLGQRDVLRFAAGEREGAPAVDLQVVASELSLSGSRLLLEFEGKRCELASPLVGSFNVVNLTAALAVGLALGLPADDCCAALARVEQVPGRLERFTLPGGAIAAVDYAHTPDALAAVLLTCRQLTDGRLILVFGCGGDRDRGKRPLMGGVAAREADLVWITSDNPRGEDPARICAEVESGFRAETDPRAGACRTVIDRTTAIEQALEAARAGDLVLVAGKGHENYQLVGSERLDLDDAVIIRDWITRRRSHA